MATERKAHIVYFEPGAEASPSLDALNELMNGGWLPVQTAAMGGAGAGGASQRSGYAALVILQREKDYAVSGFSS